MTAAARRAGLTIAREIDPAPETIWAISDGLDAYNDRFWRNADWSSHWIVGRDDAGAVRAGVHFVMALRWLFVEWLWVEEAFRRSGVGSALLLGAEDEARRNDCDGAYVDTFTFQAPKFYERRGYREFGRIADFPPGHARIWLMKRF